MENSVRYNQAVVTYDRTRAWPAPVMESLALEIVQRLAAPAPRILEIGVGTGRIGWAVASRAHVIGVDISPRMLKELTNRPRARHKLDPLLADCAYLPFLSHSFDAVLEFHVLHLIENWRAVLLEIVRVLKTGDGDAAALIRRSGDPSPKALWYRIRRAWYRICEAHGLSRRTQRPGPSSTREIDDFLATLSGTREVVEVKRWIRTYSGRAIIEDVVANVDFTVKPPSELIRLCLAELRAWAMEELGSLDIDVHEEASLSVDIWRFPATVV